MMIFTPLQNILLFPNNSICIIASVTPLQYSVTDKNKFGYPIPSSDTLFFQILLFTLLFCV